MCSLTKKHIRLCINLEPAEINRKQNITQYNNVIMYKLDKPPKILRILLFLFIKDYCSLS